MLIEAALESPWERLWNRTRVLSCMTQLTCYKDEQLSEVLSVVHCLLSEEEDPIRKRLLTIPGIKLPLRRKLRLPSFEPIKVEGELPSEQLIRERR